MAQKSNFLYTVGNHTNKDKESIKRGSNENANGIIRRFFPKGTDFSKVSIVKIQEIEDWMNDYPRRILGGISANMAVARMAA